MNRATRRQMLVRLGWGSVAAIATPVGAITLAQPPLEILAGRLTQGGWARGRAWGHLSVMLDGKAIPLDERGEFLIAFDRDAAAAAILSARDAEREIAAKPMSITPRGWQIERVDTPLRPPGLPSAEFQRIRAAELAQIAAARAKVTGADGWRQPMIRPAPGRLSGRFGAQRIYRGVPGAYHSGMDIAAASGTPILAPAAGVVVLAAANPFTLEGRLLLVDHGMGLSSAFLHCSAHLVAEGDAVRQGQPLARVGMTGRATGPHLHWGLRWRTARLDPLLFLTGPG